MRILAAHLKTGDEIRYPGSTVGEEVVEIRSDRDAVTILTAGGRLVTIGASRTVEIAERGDTLLG